MFNPHKIKFSISLICACVLHLTANAQVTFQKTFGDYSGYCYNVEQTSDGGYIMVGSTSQFGSGNTDIYLIKTDINGNTLWAKTYGGSGSEEGFSVQQTTDEGFIITGYTSSFGAGMLDVYLIKTDNGGDTLWTKTYGGTETDYGFSVRQTSDSGYVVVGFTGSFGLSDFYLIKTNNTGDILWTRTFGGYMQVSDFARSVQQTADGGYIVAGYTNGNYTGSTDVYLIKTDNNGDTLWAKNYGGTSADQGYSVQQTTDGGYIIAGYSSSFGTGISDVYLIKTDSIGAILWTKTFGGNLVDMANSVKETSDGGYIIAGSTESFGKGLEDIYLVKTNLNGELMWTRTYGGDSTDIAYSVQQTSDGGYCIAGFTGSFGAGNVCYLIKTDSFGNSECDGFNTSTIVLNTSTIIGTTTIVNSPATIVNNAATIIGNTSTKLSNACDTTTNINEAVKNEELKISPNPASDKIFVRGNFDAPALFELYDISGRKILEQKITGINSHINLSHLSKGFYIYKLVTEKAGYFTGKIIKH